MSKLSPEQSVQMSCVDFTMKCCIGVLVSASQNGLYLGEGRNIGQYIEKQKRLGMLPGEFDLMLTWDNKNILFCEMKSKRGILSESQIEVMLIRKQQGFNCFVAHSLVEYYDGLRRYGVPIRTGIYAGLGRI